MTRTAKILNAGCVFQRLLRRIASTTAESTMEMTVSLPSARSQSLGRPAEEEPSHFRQTAEGYSSCFCPVSKTRAKVVTHTRRNRKDDIYLVFYSNATYRERRENPSRPSHCSNWFRSLEDIGLTLL
jgi:hypothetical protein